MLIKQVASSRIIKHGRPKLGPAFLAILLVIGSAAGSETDKKTRALLLEATGITKDDIDRVKQKESLDLSMCTCLPYQEPREWRLKASMPDRPTRDDDRRWVYSFQNIAEGDKNAHRGRSHHSFDTAQQRSLYARQNLLTGLDEYSSFKGSAAEQRYRRYLLYDNAGGLLLDTATVYLKALQIEKNLKNREKTLEHYRGIAGELRRRVAVGRSRQSELLRTNSEIYKIEAQIESLQNSYVQTRTSLATVAGVPRDRRLLEDVCLPPAPEILPEIDKMIDGAMT